MRYRIPVILAYLIVFILVLVSCGKQSPSQSFGNEPAETERVLNITATVSPIYMLTDMIVGGVDDVELSCLTAPSDECFRSYSLSDWDISLLMDRDIVVLGGKGLESYEQLLYQLGDTGPALVTAMYECAPQTPSHILNTDDASEHFKTADPAVYMTTQGAETILNTICASMIILDPDHESQYRANREKAAASIQALTSEIAETTKDIKGKSVIIMGESLLYTAAECGLNVEACYAREYSQMLYGEELSTCIEQLKKCSANVILLEKQAPQALCEALTESGFSIVRINTITDMPATGCEAWYMVMRENAMAVVKGFI